MRRVNFEINRLTVDALVATSDSRGLVFDLSLDVGEIRKPPVRNMMEFGPFCASCGSGTSIGIAGGVWSILVIGDVDELEDERSSGADSTSSG